MVVLNGGLCTAEAEDLFGATSMWLSMYVRMYVLYIHTYLVAHPFGAKDVINHRFVVSFTPS
jgi:hypothetical protein